MAIQNLLVNGALENGIAANASSLTKPMPGWTAGSSVETWGSGANGTCTPESLQGFGFVGGQRWDAADTLAPAHDHRAMAMPANSDGSREAAAAKASTAEAGAPAEEAALAEANDNAPMQDSAFDLPGLAGMPEPAADAAATHHDAPLHDAPIADHHQAA